MGDAVANALTAAGHDSNLTSQTWNIFECEPAVTQLASWATKVFSDGVLLNGKLPSRINKVHQYLALTPSMIEYMLVLRDLVKGDLLPWVFTG